MDAIERLKLLSAQMHLEPAEEVGLSQAVSDCTRLSERKRDSIVVSKAVMPGGKRIKLLKTLLTSSCERNCFYCPFRAGRDFRRATFKPEEFARTFLALYRGGIAEGLFLSSGIIDGGVRTQDQLIDTADVLRNKLGYPGYLHLKIMPGAQRAQVERAMQLADRVSINLEAPNTKRLGLLAPRKDFFEELLQPLRWVEDIRRTMSPQKGWNGYWPSSVTQFVVGAVGESDLELLSTTEKLYLQYRLKRTYYSAFNPIPDTPLEDLPAEEPLREQRLYQASFLLRDYGFSMEELPFVGDGNLPRDADPKLAWARQNLADRPIEINKANRQELLRIPGIGPRSADNILAMRRIGLKLRSHELGDLQRVGANPKRAAAFILLDGRRPAYQMSFW